MIANFIIYSNDINKDLNPLINANSISFANNLKVKLFNLIFSQIPILITFNPFNLILFTIIPVLLTPVKLIKKIITDNKNYAGITNSVQKKFKVIYAPSFNYNIISSRFIIKSLINRICTLSEYIYNIINS